MLWVEGCYSRRDRHLRSGFVVVLMCCYGLGSLGIGL